MYNTHYWHIVEYMILKQMSNILQNELEKLNHSLLPSIDILIYICIAVFKIFSSRGIIK